ncbi:MAG: L,D-transpeptidase [Chthoniobacterales bacterium]
MTKHFKNFFRLTFLFSIGLAAGILLSACQVPVKKGPRNSFSYDPPDRVAKNPKNLKLKVSTGAQRLYLVEGDKVLVATPVSVGTSSSPTPKGNFRIYSKQATKRRVSSPGAGYPMPYWMEFKSAYGLHWGFVKPYPATHGCIRVPLKAVRDIFRMIPVGTPINIARSQPWDATIGKSLPVLDDSSLPDPPMSYMMSPKVMRDVKEGKMWDF